MIEVNEITSKMEISNMIRCLNFCEIEFSEGGLYDFNTIENIKEAFIEDFEFYKEDIIDILSPYEAPLSKEDDFFYINAGIEGLTKTELIERFDSFVLHNLCNGELKEMIEDMLHDEINY